MRVSLKHRRGQAILMVTLALFVMCGILGLAIDLGWSFFIKKSAQAAADSAALAAAAQVFQNFGSGPFATCPAGMVCGQATPIPCPATDNLLNGCKYAQQNGFVPGGENNMQNVMMAADKTSPAPTVPNVQVNYWVTARVYQGIPQLFSSVLGNTFGGAAARATAALAQITFPGTIYALDRQHDASACGTGVGACGGGNARIEAGNGAIFIASNISGAGDIPHQDSKGSGDTFIRSPGTANWAYTNMPDGPQFNDPFSGKGQPPAPTLLLAGNSFAVTGGSLDCSAPVRQGYYFAVDNKGNPTGDPITAGGSCTFGNSGVFNQFVFFGGLSLGGNTHTFNSGEYVVAGTLDLNKVDIVGAGAAGEIFILTDARYPGLAVPQTLLNAAAVYNAMTFGSPMVTMKNGSTALQGLTSSAPSNLVPFAPVFIWTDQRSSPIKYDVYGNVVTTGPCTTETGGAPSIDNPCTNPNGAKPVPPGPRIYLDHGNASANSYGTIYQPRGSTLEITDGTASISGPVQIITGTVKIDSGNGSITPSPVSNPPKGIVVSLIE